MSPGTSNHAATLLEGAEAARNAAAPYARDAEVARRAATVLSALSTSRPRDSALAAEASRQAGIAQTQEDAAAVRIAAAKKLTALAAQVSDTE